MARRTLHSVLFTILCLCFLINISKEQCLTPNDDDPRANKLAFLSLYEGQQNFSLDLLAEINKRVSSKDNIFFSPYSVYHALLLSYFLAKNHTEKALHKALRYSDSMNKQDILKAYKLDKLRGAPYEFASSNKIFVSKDLRIRDCMESIFNQEIEKLDFKNSMAAVDHINKFVAEHTKGMITDLLPADAIDQMTTLVLANAAYFKGEWESRFPEEETHKNLFYSGSSETHIVDMMTQEGTFDYDTSETLGAHILRLPYKGEQASMFILLPPFSQIKGGLEKGLENVMENLNANTIRDIVMPNKMYPRTVNVTLPKFSVEKTLELAPILQGLGVGDLLQSTADLSALIDTRMSPNQKVSLGGAIHKARIELNEEGTEAAAATAIFTFRSSRPAEPAQFNANHPFVYFIYDSKKKAILFAGVFRRPKNTLANTL